MIAVFFLALALRLGFVLTTTSAPLVGHLIGDAAAYDAWARRIVHGEWLGTEAFYQAPLYPYVLAVVKLLIGDGVSPIRVVQAVWGSLAVVLLTAATGRRFGRRAGVVAGVLFATYAPAVFFDGIVQKTSLASLLLCALMFLMAHCASRRGAWRRFLVGAALGLLCLARENALVWMPVVGAWIVADGGDRNVASRARAAAAFVIGLAVILVPVGARNALVGGEWSLTTFQSGPNFYIGNNLEADGRYRPLVRGHESPEFERRDATELAQRATGRSLSAGEVSAYWMRRALDDIRASPMRWVRLMALKTAMVFNAYEVADAESIYVDSSGARWLARCHRVWHFGVLVPLAAMGWMQTRSMRRRLYVDYAMIVAMAGSVAAFYVLARYRYPLAPLLMPFAAAGCVGAWDRVRHRAFRALAQSVALAGLVAIAVNWPVHDTERLNAMAELNVGVALARAGDLTRATEAFERAVRGHPESAEANNNLAQALALRGDYGRAVEHYERALHAARTLAGVDYNLAVAQEQLGQRDAALRRYERALQLDPSDEDARRAIARLRDGD